MRPHLGANDGAAVKPSGPILWEEFEGPIGCIPLGRQMMYQVYGDPLVTYARDGSVRVNRTWEQKNLVLARNLPCGVPKLYCHRLMEPYLREALRRAELVSDYMIRRIGCFNPRHQRHDPGRPLSDHTWAIAVDINPDKNLARDRSQGAPVPKPFDPGWERFSDIPWQFVEAFESVGFEWGGRWKYFADTMHFALRKTMANEN